MPRNGNEVQWFEKHRANLVPLENDDLLPEQEAEILRRRDQALSHPDLLEPWEGSMTKARQHLHEFRRQKAAKS